VSQFWDAADRIFSLAKEGKEQEARDEIRLSLQARQAALSTAVARLLVENNLAEEQTAGRVQDIYSEVLRQEYWFVGATFTTILFMSLYLIRSNRRLFAELASLSDERREFARQLIETRESTLREISRELHDEFGQILTAMGSMIGRAGRHVPEGSPLQAELHEIREIAQTTLDNVRGLSQTLHPSILEEAGLEGTIEWYLPTVERQTGLAVSYERSGPSREIPNAIAIHVYRVLQEALNNVARHSGTSRVWVRLRTSADRLELEVEDHGTGLAPAAVEAPESSNRDGRRRGLGLVAMRERAAIAGGTIEFRDVPDGGTLIRMTVPLAMAGTRIAGTP
jgi:signal transduction histidine kinase